MIELIKLDTQAINTARLSARSVKLNPSINSLVSSTVLPDKTSGISFNERINEENTKIKAAMFLKRRDTLLASGRKNAPTTGIKTIAKTNQL